MKVYRIAFVGHRQIEDQMHFESRLEHILRAYLHNKEYVEFYVGRNGDFDISVASAVKRLQKAFGNHNSRLILVQPYPMKDDPYFEKFYDEIYHPVKSTTHPKAAITKRNQWMIDNADLLIAYAEPNRCGGAAVAVRYAEKHGVKILNLLNLDP